MSHQSVNEKVRPERGRQFQRVAIGGIVTVALVGSFFYQRALRQSHPGPAVLATPSTSSVTPDMSTMLSLINQARSEAGVPAVDLDTVLPTIAAHHSKEVRKAGKSHDLSTTEESTLNSLPWTQYVGLGAIWRHDPSMQTVFDDLMHQYRSDILDPSYKLVGIGVLRDGPSAFVTIILLY